MNTKIIKLDLNRRLYDKIIAKQGDTKSRFLLFQLLDGSIAFNLTNRSVRAYMVKPDGKEIFNDLIINNSLGYCTLELTNQVLAVPGTVKIELMVTEEDRKLTSSVFELEVIKSINSEKSIVSTNEFTALINGLSSLSEYDNYKNEIAAARDGEVNLLTKVKKIDEQLDTKANELSNRIDNIVAHAGDGTKDTEIIDARGGDTCLNNRLVGIENGEYINEVSFKKIKKARPRGEIYTIDNFNKWSKWSAVSGEVNKVSSLSNGGIEIAIEEALTSNLVVSKSGINFHGKKVTLKFDITVNSIISFDDRFTLALNDSLTLKTVNLNEFKIGKTTTVSIDFNDTKLVTGKLSLVLNKPCNCNLENLKLEECMAIDENVRCTKCEYLCEACGICELKE